MPRHRNYVEPYAGGLAVLLTRDPLDPSLLLGEESGVSEVVNDVDGGVTNFWRVLASTTGWLEFRRKVEAIGFCEELWRESLSDADCDSDVDRAAKFFVRCRQSLAGRRKSFAAITKGRTRRGMNEQAAGWLSAVEGLPAIHERLKRVLVLNRDALEAIEAYDREDTLVYADPPYLPETRASPDVYRHEMTLEQHEAMLALLKASKAKVMLSGYPNAIYDEALSGWRREEFDLPNNAAGGEGKRRMTEVLWRNF